MHLHLTAATSILECSPEFTIYQGTNPSFARRKGDMTSEENRDPHLNGGVVTGGTGLREAAGAVILLHARGGTAAEMLTIGQEICLRGLALLAPQAANRTWFPHGFFSPIAANEPWLSSAMKRVRELIITCTECCIPLERIVLVGFSQGAFLATEFVARNPNRYGGLVVFTGGLLGPIGSDLFHEGSLQSTPVLLSSGDPDSFVPWSRVEETAAQLRAMEGNVEVKRIPGRAHTVSAEELDSAQRLLCRIFNQ